MLEMTYDPIIERRALPALRLISPLRPPDMGQALVLVPRTGEAHTVHHGGTVPYRRMGVYQYCYLVDITEHRLLLNVPLLSKDPSFAFRGSVGLIAKVHDPVEVVSRGIHDVSGALRDYTKWRLRQVSREYDIAQFHEAEHALNAEVSRFTGDSAIRLRNVTVELMVDDDEVIASGRAYRDVERDTRLSGKRRDRHLDMMRRDGVEGLLAEIVENEGARAALEWIAHAEASEREELMKALETVLDHSDPHREPFDLLHAERTVLDRLMDGSTAPFGGTRPGRVRGTIRPGLEAGRDERTPGEPERDGHRRGGTARTGGTVRGTVFTEPDSEGPAEPPDDEPAGGVTDEPAGPYGSRAGERSSARGSSPHGDRGGPGPATPGASAEEAKTGPVNGTSRRASRIRGASSSADRTREEPRP